MPLPTALFLGWKDSPVSAQVEAIVRRHFDLLRALPVCFGEKVDQDALAALAPEFLFSFGPLMVRAPLLGAVRRAAINFHTAPPRWPGRGSCSFALFEGDTEFGVTAHLMALEADAGPILRVLRFPIEPTDSADSLRRKSLDRIPELVELVIADLAAREWQVWPSGELWERKALRQKDLEALMRIDPSESAQLVERKVRALAHPSKPGPYVELHGRRFWFTAESNTCPK